ncbi:MULTISPECIES: phospho-N-acetylmuramoyl-pentapeptide-transferase [Asticcacaulis]|uniref:phospho-N-acetylmuramoyl-pentapeptide- transferase n=1 Tax=Asticcacaulis TaxID=76890 RepID=UPI001AE208A6|nr:MULTISPECIES: phospho-N-acetylmuramoyl-pentapeptide-transferase [Asticcacaulis]MBP2157633.1 phospho-N-acetylmuramoyl-pentapeptide-transferase [Asticcacaulis solisilvae]MDR6798678.1 phospho-N-acetylmuramoyl-pentapeptide-transferase [Asticcacaulis sp. BE141]
MFYLLYEHLNNLNQHWPLINLMRYQTVRVFLALITAMIVAVAMGSRFINWMRARQGKGQPIREDGPQSHLLTKKGTPTMGGLMILAGIAVATLLWIDPRSASAWVVFGVTMAYGVLGYIDDYAKVTKQTSAGLTSIQKLIAQIAIAVVAVLVLIYYTPQPADTPKLATSLVFPIFKNAVFDLGLFFVVFGAVVIVGASNAVNLTDGLDGLAIVPVMIAAGAFGFIAYVVGNFKFAEYLIVHFVPGAGEVAVICAAIIGGGMGFLWYNAPPAKIFMGDTGSLALGGGLGAVAVATKHEIVLAIIGGLFVVEAMSVMIQVGYFKLTKKRIFLMAPIHHHFEKLGWPESTVVIRFWIVAALLAMVGLATLKLR